jgi:hypothetical protein
MTTVDEAGRNPFPCASVVKGNTEKPSENCLNVVHLT